MNSGATLCLAPPSSEKCNCQRFSRTGRFFDDVPGGRSPAFFCSVIHDRDAGSNGTQKDRAVALIPTVMRDDVNIDGTDLVIRADEFPFLVARQITQIQNAQLSKCDERAQGARVFGLVRGNLFSSFTAGIRLTGSGQWMVNQSAIRTHHGCLYSADGEDVAWFQRQAINFFFREQFLVSIPDLDSRRIRALAVIAVINDRSHGDSRHQLRQATDVIHVKVCDQDVVELADPGLLGHGNDAVGVSAIIAGPTRVDQQRFAGRRDEQRRLATLNIHEEYPQRIRRRV